MDKDICNLLLITSLLLWDVTGGVRVCPYIAEEGRAACSAPAAGQVDCEAQHCCWDPQARDDSLKCFREECREGYFGWGCRFQCRCKTGEVCDRYTGQCPSGCPSNGWGKGCLLDNGCTYNDVFGAEYMGKNVRTENGHTCGGWTNQRAYPGDQFPDGDIQLAENFCRNPQPQDHRTWCYYRFGSNRRWDYCRLNSCDCPQGLFDVNCAGECHCADPAEACHQKTGACQSGCDRRWTGVGCQACADGHFGRQCEKLCHCDRAEELCHKDSGHCESGCALGWAGADCQAACQDGWYGRNCEGRCNCRDPQEVCDKESGACVTGCSPGYSGDGCQIQLPAMTRAPVTKSRGASSITVTWPAWASPPDVGDGPVKGYFLYLKTWNDTVWRSLRADDREITVDNLTQGTAYQFKVVPIHFENFVGLPSPIHNVSTCGKPLSGPTDIRLTPEESSGRRGARGPSASAEEEEAEPHLIQLSVAWRIPPSAEWGCDRVTHYEIYFRQPGDADFRRYSASTATHFSLEDVDMYSNYTVGVALVNSAGLESDLTRDTFVGKSGPVERLSLTSQAPTSLAVLWSPPANSNGQVLYYVLRYKRTRLGDCGEDQSSWSPRLDVDPDRKTYVISELQPYSRYQVKVWPQTAAGKGMAVFMAETTQAAAPTETVADFHQVEVGARSASFEWKAPPCETRNGAFSGFRYELVARGDQGGEEAMTSDLVNATDVMLRPLVPYTDYSLQVWVVNHVLEGPRTRPSMFRTLEDVPPAPGNPHVRVAASDSLTVAWSPPSPPHGIITGYEFKFWSSRNLGQRPVAIKVAPTTTDFDMIQLLPNASYGVQVRASTVVGPGQWSSVIYGFTEEAIPGEPAMFTNATRTMDSITFKWSPPEKRNGVLRKYKVLCSPLSTLARYLDSDREEEVESDQAQYTLRGLQPGTGYVCTLRASTSKGYGPATRNTFFTKPKLAGHPAIPKLDNTLSTDNSLTIKLQSSPMLQLDLAHATSLYRIVVERLREREEKEGYTLVRRDVSGQGDATRPCGLPEAALLPYAEAHQQGHACYVAAQIGRIKGEFVFVVGDNKTYGGFYNAPLQKGGTYDVWFGIVVTVDGETAASYSKTDGPAIAAFVVPDDGGSMALAGASIGVALAIILLVAILVIVCIKKKKQNREACHTETTDTERLDASPKMYNNHHEKVVLPDLCSTVLEDDGADCAETEPLYANAADEERHPPIAVEHLWNVVKEKRSYKPDGLKAEYDELPMGLRAKCEIARKQENKTKNRYGNIVAYDHSRVLLDCLEGDPHSDYINGNYIDAYMKPQAYIATQGPSKYTLNDMWRAAWQLNSHRIIMVTNLVEDGRISLSAEHNQHKCEQYWPEGEPRTYDDITVEMTDVEQFADFMIRSFNITKDGTTKPIHQFHFTSWPDHGVPQYATSLLAFRKKVRSYDDPTAGPTIVHCSAGVGRTGTFIAVDYLLDQAKTEGQVDIYHCVKQMRTKRTNMVQTLEQYLFVYDALLEALKSGDTSYPCNSFRQKYAELLQVSQDTGRVRLEEEYELLGTMSPSVGGTNSKDILDPENLEKNRHQDIVPLDNLSRPYLLTYIPGATDYINAVFVDGYKQRDAFIITQMPLPNTLVDFWAMVYDHDCRTVIMMNDLDPEDPTCARYYPEDAGTVKHGQFSVETVAVDPSVANVLVRDLSLTYNKRGLDEARTVRQFQYQGWARGQSLPSSCLSLITLLGMVEKWQQRSGNQTIIVHCMNGADRSGLFCAISYMVERLKVEQEVDVFQSVKHTRVNRPQIVPSLEQYQFVYDMAVEYMDCFATYANFK